MPRKQGTWQTRIKSVEREYIAVRLATDRLLEIAGDDPSVLKTGVLPGELRRASDSLEGTYIIRIFADFETGLRSCWAGLRRADPPSRTVDLVSGSAARHKVNDENERDVHALRNYRNSLVHERIDIAEPISIAKARRDLCKFFSFLPPDW